jgi:prepilin-type N-terminal cleavage/methylation domain-containing protein
MNTLLTTKRQPKLRSEASGFTIIELLIATSVFSVILLLCSFGLIQIGRIYYKGITGAKTQEVARNIVEDISQAIQFSGGQILPTHYDRNGDGTHDAPPSDPDGAYLCVGTRRYSYILDRQLAVPQRLPNQIAHVFVADEIPGGCTSSTDVTPGFPTGTISHDAREIMGENMRLAELVVEQVGLSDDLRLYRVEVMVVSGENDMLIDDSANANYHKQCSGQRADSQYCAVSALKTVVQKRIN